jgi:hypothetical protein
VVPARDLEAAYGLSADEIDRLIREQFRTYRATLQDDRRHLLERFQVVDLARKVVGVGSVGTRAFIVLLQDRDQQDPLFLQVKEATASVLEGPLPKSRYRFYAGICGWTLARAHARSGDPVAIAEYLGEDDQFHRSINDFAKRYADQNDRDYQAFADAIRSGRLQALDGA